MAAGDSLVGARRQVFLADQLTSATREWLDAVPESVPAAEDRKNGRIWHFLVPDKGMADYNDKAVKQMLPEEMKQFRDWRRDFTKRFSPGDVLALERLSYAVDRLYARHLAELGEFRRETAHVFPIFGQEKNPAYGERGRKLTTRDRDRIYEQRLTPRTGPASPYQRLKLAMDYWCALWFWPVDRDELLPSRDEFLLEISAILEGTSRSVRPLFGAEQREMFAGGKPKQGQLKIADDLGEVDLDEVCERLPRLALVREIAERRRFLHWELEFADLFVERGGFDLILGNPPWIRIVWQEGGVMSDFEPLFVLRKFSVPKMRTMRDELFAKHVGLRRTYFEDFAEYQGVQNYVSAKQNYPLLQGIKSNTYKSFVTQAWRLAADGGVQGYVHQEGVYDDPKGGVLRSHLYRCLLSHFQFQNELLLFAEINHPKCYSVNVYAADGAVRFAHCSNLFHPSTLDESLDHEGSGVCGGIKDQEGNWNVAGHRDRILEVDEETLQLFARLYDDPGTPALEARLPSLHARELVAVLRKLAEYPRRLGDLEGQYVSTAMWDETNRVGDGTIRRETRFPGESREWVLPGPHIYVANPLFKTPNEGLSRAE